MPAPESVFIIDGARLANVVILDGVKAGASAAVPNRPVNAAALSSAYPSPAVVTIDGARVAGPATIKGLKGGTIVLTPAPTQSVLTSDPTAPTLVAAPIFKGEQGGPGPAGPSGARFGGVDYTDLAEGVPLLLPQDTPVQMNRALGVKPQNDTLAGPFLGFNFIQASPDDTRLVARKLHDIIDVYTAIEIVPNRAGGFVRFAVDVGGAFGVIVADTKALTGPVGQMIVVRFFCRILCRPTFLANGGRMLITSTVPATLLSFSPEIYPFDAAP